MSGEEAQVGESERECYTYSETKVKKSMYLFICLSVASWASVIVNVYQRKLLIIMLCITDEQ